MDIEQTMKQTMISAQEPEIKIALSVKKTLYNKEQLLPGKKDNANLTGPSISVNTVACNQNEKF